MSRDDPPEKQVAALWSHSAGGKDLRTEDGRAVRVVYPGRWNEGQGADILDSVLVIGNEQRSGDIEIHTRSSGWQAHQHDRDPAYNGVILHVVLRHDTGEPVRLQSGGTVPTLELPKGSRGRPRPGITPYPVQRYVACNGAVHRMGGERVGELLELAGEQRFLGKAGEFAAGLSSEEEGEVLYRGIMGGLGYSRNKLPFQELARRLPLRSLEPATRGGPPDERILMHLQAMLIGTAGLLPSQSANLHRADGERWVRGLEEAWRSSAYTEPMAESEWRLSRVRPGNYPTRRIAAMSHLVLRHHPAGIFARVMGGAGEAARDCRDGGLEGSLLVGADGYWASHYDFGAGSRIAGSALIGRARAAVIAVNVCLPFIYAWADRAGQPQLAGTARRLYRQYPSLPGNAVEAHMRRQMGLGGGLANSACRQQGLLHIYRTQCTRGRCGVCPLSAGGDRNYRA